ncbi:MAG: hypothetical protein LBD75_02835 [Candidatus Peribacteria bacterium]|jgi:hypothetical protein|nr:hypothetical protein [Candidatus Peribacteria bacterium]
MTKKEYLLKLLTLLAINDPIISGLNVLLTQGEISDTIIDYFIDSFQNYGKTLHSEEEKEKINKAVQFLTAIKKREQKNLETDQNRLSELDVMLEHF